MRDIALELVSIHLCALAVREGLALRWSKRWQWGKPWSRPRRVGFPQVVAQGETGLLVPPGDVESLAATVVSLLED